MLINSIDVTSLPTRKDIEEILHYFDMLIFPCTRCEKTLEEIVSTLSSLLRAAFEKVGCNKGQCEVEKFLARVAQLRDKIEGDLKAFYDNDPACQSIDEVVLSYPGFHAIMVYRLAHELYLSSVPLLPRIMSEVVHSRTGIDINPGCSIGERFFIDHGTGVVIGETCSIGDDVKIYQGVTLGALSTKGGQKLKGTKRHPTIGNRVTIYSNATVLGGDTIIGDDSIIGGNAFITSSIQANSKVLKD